MAEVDRQRALRRLQALETQLQQQSTSTTIAEVQRDIATFMLSQLRKRPLEDYLPQPDGSDQLEPLSDLAADYVEYWTHMCYEIIGTAWTQVEQLSHGKIPHNYDPSLL
jgi:hypothetical protein